MVLEQVMENLQEIRMLIHLQIWTEKQVYELNSLLEHMKPDEVLNSLRTIYHKRLLKPSRLELRRLKYRIKKEI